jgi:hypothetical protein
MGLICDAVSGVALTEDAYEIIKGGPPPETIVASSCPPYVEPPLTPAVRLGPGHVLPFETYRERYTDLPPLSSLLQGSSSFTQTGYGNYHGIIKGGVKKRGLEETTTGEIVQQAVKDLESAVKDAAEGGTLNDFVSYWAGKAATLQETTIKNLTIASPLQRADEDFVRANVPAVTAVIDVLPNLFSLVTSVVDKVAARSQHTIRDEYKSSFDAKMELVAQELQYRLLAWWEVCYNLDRTKLIRDTPTARELTAQLQRTIQKVFQEVGVPGTPTKKGTLLDLLEDDEYWQIEPSPPESVFITGLFATATMLRNYVAGAMLSAAKSTWRTAFTKLAEHGVGEWVIVPLQNLFQSIFTGVEPVQHMLVQEAANAATYLAYCALIALLPSLEDSYTVQVNLGLLFKAVSTYLFGKLFNTSIRGAWSAVVQAVNVASRVYERVQRWWKGSLAYDVQRARRAQRRWRCDSKYGCIVDVQGFLNYESCKAECEVHRLLLRGAPRRRPTVEMRQVITRRMKAQEASAPSQ